MIKTPELKLDSPLAKTVIELESIKNRSFTETTAEGVFLQLKSLLHAVEAVASARIEGNHTTIASYIEKRNLPVDETSEQIVEISNLDKALNFIDENITKYPIDLDFIRELHRVVVSGLGREGDGRAGAWREHLVKISNSKHQPPEPYDVADYMRELVEYLDTGTDSHLDLIKIAIVNHRFVWIHPFGNGNGRTDRLLTYALLCKKGYIVPSRMRMFNPTAVFAGDREKYYDMLSLADDNTNEHLLAWCSYFLDGILVEVKKNEKLADQNFVTNELLLPAIDAIYWAGFLSEMDANIVRRAAKLGSFKSADIEDLWKNGTSRATIAKHLGRLKDGGFIRALREGGREYEICFENNQLTRMVLEQMDKAGLLPIRVDR